MNSRFAITQSSTKVNPDFTVSSAISDVSLSEEKSAKRAQKRCGFRKMTKATATKSRERPGRRIKLNRSIFNSKSTAKPVFHVNNCSEEGAEAKFEASEEVSVVVNNTAASNFIIPVRSVSVHQSDVNQGSRTVSGNSASLSRPLGDIRTVVKRKSLTTPLLQPNIQITLNHLGEDACQYRNYDVNKNRLNFAVPKCVIKKNKAPQESPPGKCIVSPPGVSTSIQSPLKRRKISPVRPPSPSSDVGDPNVMNGFIQNSTSIEPPHSPLEQPPLEQPPSPALSLGANSDDDLENEISTPLSRRVVINESSTPEKPKKQVANTINSWLGHRKFNLTHCNGEVEHATDDILDVMSVIADDDLFSSKCDKKTDGQLKRSLSQDSVFNMRDENANKKNFGGNVVKNNLTENSQNESISRTLSLQSFRIPRRNISNKAKNCQNKGEALSNSFQGPHHPPKPTRLVARHDQLLNDTKFQDMVKKLMHCLQSRDIPKVVHVLKELGDAKKSIEIGLLQRCMSVLHSVEATESKPDIAKAALSLFDVLKQRNALGPKTFIFTILTLCKCCWFQKGFDKLSEMLNAKVLPVEEELVVFVENLLDCLDTRPKWLLELIFRVKQFGFLNPTGILDNCLSSLFRASGDVLRGIDACQWNKLIDELSFPPNTEVAMRVQDAMEANFIPMSDQFLTKLAKLFHNSRCTKKLLDLIHLKSIPFDIAIIFNDSNLSLADVEAHILELVHAGSVPSEEVIHQYINRATFWKEFKQIYNVFIKCKASSIPLPVTVLQKMVEALENWDDNINASVEVYSALRKAKVVMKTESRTTPPLNNTRTSNKHQPVCKFFMKNGRCKHGSNCRYYHDPARNGMANAGNFGEKNSLCDGDRGTPTPMASKSINARGVNHFPSFQIRPMFPAPSNCPPQQMPALIQAPFHARANFRPRFVPPAQPPVPCATTKTTPQVNTCNGSQLSRSFSWEPGYSHVHRNRNKKHSLAQSSPPGKQDQSPGSDTSNYELQQRVTSGIEAGDWHDIYVVYVDFKQRNNSIVRPSDLKVFRSSFLRDADTSGANFAEFVNFVRKEKGSIKSSSSDSECPNVFDKYDIEFIGSLGVSLMERCQNERKYDPGYKVLHALHSHDIPYYDCGKNFGAYREDIPSSSVAVIAIKLCLGLSDDDYRLNAVEVLHSSGYATPIPSAPDDVERRIRVLQQVFELVLDKENVTEAYQILCNIHAKSDVMVELCTRVINFHVSKEDYNEAFAFLKDGNLNLDVPACQSLYEMFLKRCVSEQRDQEAIAVLEEMESSEIELRGSTWQGLFKLAQSCTNELLVDMLFRRCQRLAVYPTTFSSKTPLVCKLGCGYTELELKLMIRNHLRHLCRFLIQSSPHPLSPSHVRELEIVLFPRVSEDRNMTRHQANIPTLIAQSSALIRRILEEELNPPLQISDVSKENFSSKFKIDHMSLFRWLSSNQNDDDNETSSNTSLGSLVSTI